MEVRKWPDIPYHFLIDLQGTIYIGRPINAAGDTNTLYDPTGHALIAVLGDYDRQRPNQDQLGAIVALMAWIADEYDIPATRIAGHRDFVPVNAEGKHWDKHTRVEITCPGAHLYALLHSGYFQAEVQRRLEEART